MGEVYLAQDTRLERFVALKFLPEEFTHDAARRQRFFSEARAAAALAHPHICTVYDVAETEDGRPYIAMEWLEGPTLRERLKGAPLRLDELLEVGLRVAEALEAAHARGIVHRDVKPGNVSVAASGLVKVLDFGLVKWMEPQSSMEAPSRTTVLETESGQIMGTPGYMSPEQATGQPVDQRSDLFSLGVMLYEMATGRPPFGGSNWAEILRGIVERQPEPMVRFNGEAPAELERIVLKCLQKAPGARYQSARELRIDLAAFQASLAAPTSTASGPLVTFLCLEVPEALRLKGSGRLQAAAELIREEQGKLQKLLSGPEGRVEAVGDSLLARFGRPSEAVQVALRMVSEGGVPCRLGLHLGEVIEPGQAEPLRRYGAHLETGVRLMQLAEPGHILMSRGVFDSARVVVKREEVTELGALSWVSHGPYEFSGLEEPLEVCEVGLCQRGGLPAPRGTERAKRLVKPEGDPVLGWRPAVGQEVPNTKWVLEEKLGEGGFGEVWQARHEKLNERRVFKFCFRADRLRFLQREVTLFRLIKDRFGEHPNIVRLYNFFFDQPPFYLEEEYVPGKDLRSWCETQGGVEKVPLEVRLEIVAQIADGLQAAHDAGVIHRDVKPGNILIAECGLRSAELHSKAKGRPILCSSNAEGGSPKEAGTLKSESSEPPPSSRSLQPLTDPQSSRLSPPPLAKLTDFGIGQVLSQEYLAGVTKEGFTMTMLAGGSSSQTGTQLYMAPEIWEGKPASTRSDIYSLGVVLYQLVVGDFTRPLATDWANDIPDPLVREDLHHCLAGKPADRFAAAALLGKNLRALPERRAEMARRAAEKAALEREAYRRGMLRTASIASVIVAIILVLAWQVWANALAKSRQAAQIRSTTVRLTVAKGLNAAKTGDWLSACLWFSEAFVLDELFQVAGYSPLGQQNHRLRIDSLLLQSPRLEQMWFEPGTLCGFFDPAGEQVLLGGKNGYRLYGIQSGQPSSPVVGKGDELARLSPDGRRILTSGGEGNHEFVLWDAASGAHLASLPDREGAEPFGGGCNDLQFSPDGRWIAAALRGPEGRIVIWNTETARLQRTFTYADNPNLGWTKEWEVFSVRFDSSGERLVTTGKDKRAVIWDWKQALPLQVLRGHDNWVYGGCFGQQHTNWILTCSFDRSACLWDLRKPEQPITRVYHEGDAVSDIQFSPDDTMFLTGGLDSTVRFWDSVTGRPQPPMLRSHDRVMQVCWSTNGKRILGISSDGVARVWRLDKENSVVKPVSCVLSDDGRVTVEQDGARRQVRDRGAGTVLGVRELAPTNTSVLCFAGGTNHLLCLSDAPEGTSPRSTQVRLWDLAGSASIGSPLTYDPSWSRLVCAPGGRRIAFFAGDDKGLATPAANGVLVWQPGGHPETNLIAPPDEVVEAVAFDQTGGRLAIGSRQRGAKGVLRLLDLETAKEPSLLLECKQSFSQLTFSSDGRWLAAACWDLSLDPGDVLVWRLSDLNRTNAGPVRLHHMDGVLCAAFSDTSQMIATGSEDQTAMVWRQRDGGWKASSRPLRCDGPVYACAFSHNSRWLATANRTPAAQPTSKNSNTQVQIWDIANNEPVTQPFPFSEKVTRLEFVAGDTHLYLEELIPPDPAHRYLINLAVNRGSAQEYLLRAELMSGQRSFLSDSSQPLSQALEGILSAEATPHLAASVGPRGTLSLEDCRKLWLQLLPGVIASP